MQALNKFSIKYLKFFKELNKYEQILKNINLNFNKQFLKGTIKEFLIKNKMKYIFLQKILKINNQVRNWM